MSLSPVPFLRAGFAILGLALAFAIWLGFERGPGVVGMLAGLVGFLAATTVGERIVRRVATREENRADLEDRVRNGD